jgi:hypothetical protein
MPTHAFHALAFVDNLSLKGLAAAYPEARRTAHELWYPAPEGGTVFIYPFGAMTLYDVPPGAVETHMARLRALRPTLRDANAVEDLIVREEPIAHPDMREGELVVDHLGAEGVSVIAMTVAQSAAMDYYERIVDEMFDRTDHLVDRLK